MVSNPFADGGLSVKLDADSSGLRSEISDATSKLGDFRTVALGAGAVVGGGLAAGLKASVDAAASFESAMVEVEKVTDPETARAMGESIKDMAEEMPIAQEELAGITEQAARLGIEGTENLEDYTRTAAQMATATDLTADEAADSFARIGTLMDIPIEQSSNLGSAMNTLANTMGTSSSEITDVMTRAGGALNSLGVGKEQALALAGAMNEVSPSSRLAAGGMKRMAEAMMDPGNAEALSQALGVTQEEFKRMRDNDPSGTLLKIAEASNESKDTANELRAELGKAGSEFVTLGQNTDSAREATKRAGKAWEENTSLTEEAESAASTFSAQLQMVKNRFQNFGITIGTRVLPHLKSFLDAVVAGVEYLSALNKRLDGALVAGALGGALSILAAAAWVAVPAVWALVAPMLPLAAVIAAVSVAIGGLYYAVQNNILGLGDIFDSVMGGIASTLEVAKGVIDDFVTFIGLILKGDFAEAWSFAKEAVIAGITGAVQWLQNDAIPAMKAGVGMLVTAYINVWSTIIKKAKQVAIDAIGAIATYLSSIGKDDIKAAFKEIGSAIRSVVLGLFKAGGTLYSIVEDGHQAMVDYLREDAAADFKAAMRAVGDAAYDAFTAFVNSLTPPDGLIRDLFKRMNDYIENQAASDIRAAVGVLIDGVVAAFTGLYEGLIGGSLIPDLFQDVAAYIYETAKGLVVGAVEAVVDSIMGTFRDWYDDVIGVGGLVKDLFGAVADYISGTAAGDLVSATADAARAAANEFIDKFNQVMPSSVPIPTVTIGGGTIPNPIPGKSDFKIGTASLGGGDWSMPQLDEGGFIESGGFAQLHAGETVVPAEVSRNGGGGGDTYVDGIDVHIEGDADRQDVKRGVSDALRSINAGR